MNDIKRSIHISYGNDATAKTIINILTPELELINYSVSYDANTLNYRGSIYDYINSINNHNKIILIMNGKYLRSKYCMYELTEILRNKDFSKSIYPIVIDDAQRYLYFIEGKIEMRKYWLEELNHAELLTSKAVDEFSLNLCQKERNNIKKILNALEILIEYFSDINSIHISGFDDKTVIQEKLKLLIEAL